MGILLLISSVLTTFFIWLSPKDIFALFLDPLLSLSQILALIGLVLVSWTLLLSTKLHFVEKLFKGLDQSYRFHRLIGSTAFILLINHPLLLVIKALPSTETASIYFLPTGQLSYALGIIGIYLFILSFLFIVFIKLPYHVWKLSHKLLGVAFIFGALHSLLIGSDLANSLILRTWIILFILLGSFSSFYTLVLYRRFGHKLEFLVDRVHQKLDVVNLYLKPLKHRLAFKAGQFVYLSVSNNPSVGDELHPFSISSSPQEQILRISAKISGDYTLKLSNLKKRDKVLVYGPYGYFPRLKNQQYNQVWVAGGIGITPFLSLLSSPYVINKNIHLFYCVKDKHEAVFTTEIEKLIKNLPNIKLTNWYSQTQGRINVNQIKNQVKYFSNTNFLICGPTTMMKSLKTQLIKTGIKTNQIYFENFSLDD